MGISERVAHPVGELGIDRLPCMSSDAVTTSDTYRYDVFISYRQREPDRGWVRGTLLPALETHGLAVCIDFRDFRLGATIVTEMERSIEESRYTLAILTPAYLESHFTDLENVLAEHLGLEEGQNRLLIVDREPTKPSLRMRARLRLDMTDDATFDVGVARLMEALRRPDSRPH
jgi:hypothetical protein